MATISTNVRIENVKDTTANWERANPILLDGEIGIEEKLNGQLAIKIGNGITHWTELDYVNSLTVKEIETLLDKKVDKIDGMGLSQNNYSNEDKAKLNSLGSGVNFKGYVSSVELLPTNATAGDMYFASGENSATLCCVYSSENGWKTFEIFSVDLTNYIQRDDIDTELNTASTNPIQNKAVALHLEAHDSQLTQLQEKVETNITDIASHYAQIQENKTNIGVHEAEISTLNNNVNSLTTGLQTAFNSINTKIDDTSKNYVPIRYITESKNFDTDFKLSTSDPNKVIFSCPKKILSVNAPFGTAYLPYILIAERIYATSLAQLDFIKYTCMAVEYAETDYANIVEYQRYFKGGVNPIWTEWETPNNNVDLSEYYTKTETDSKISEIESDFEAFSPYSSCYFILGYGGYIDFNTTDCIVTIPRDTVLISEKVSKSINFDSDVTIDYSGISSTAIKIVYYLSTGTFEVLKYNATIENPSDTIVICAFRTDTNGTFSYAISINAPYSIDGVPYNINAATSDITPKVMLNNNVKSVNHRGYGTAPENTLAAYRLSKINGFEYVETDISFTSDNIPVCLHDNTIDRTSNGTGNISDLTFDEVRAYDFGSWKSSSYAGVKIPSFEEFVLLCRNLGLIPYIELKSGTQEQIEACVDIVEKYGMRGKVTWISFSSTCLTYVKNYDSEARLGYVANTIDETIIERVQSLITDTNEVFVDTNYTTLTDEICDMCAEANLPLEVWTVNTKSAITSLNPYVSGVTSDTLIASHILMLKSLGVEELNTGDEQLYIDTDLDTASTNPVQNKAVATEIASLKTGIVDVQSNTAVNLFIPDTSLSYSASGITMTINPDGTFILNGTATATITNCMLHKTASISGQGKYLHVFLLSGTAPDNFSGVIAMNSSYGYVCNATLGNPAKMTDTATYAVFRPKIISGDTFTNAKFGVVVTDAAVDSYIPYIADGNTISEKVDNAVTTLQSQIDTNTSDIEDIQTELTQTTAKATDAYKGLITANTNISDIQTELTQTTTKANTAYIGLVTANTNISDLQDDVSKLETNLSSHSHAWSDITNKPSSFTPSSHTHTISSISDFPTVVGQPDYSTKTNLKYLAKSEEQYAGTYTPTADCWLALYSQGASTASTTVAWGRIMVNDLPICSILLPIGVTKGIGNMVFIPAGTEVSYTLCPHDKSGIGLYRIYCI